MSVRKQHTLFKHRDRRQALTLCTHLRSSGLDAYVIDCERCGYFHVQSPVLHDTCTVETRPEAR